MLRETTRPVRVVRRWIPGRSSRGRNAADPPGSGTGGLIGSVAPADPHRPSIGGILKVPLILAHVIEPVKTRHAARIHVPTLEADRRAVARIAWPSSSRPSPGRRAEALVAYGDPSEELAKIARTDMPG